MSSPQDYKDRRDKRRALRKERSDRLLKWVPVVAEMCQAHNIGVKEIPGGYQYRTQEYILNWWPSSNKISIQYIGRASETRPFEPDDEPGKPRILLAIEKLIRVAGSEQSVNPTS